MPRQQLIKIRSGSSAPNAADFATAEPAWDSTNKRFYIKAADGTMVQIGGGTSAAVRIDSTSTANTIYVGKAPAGSSESSAVWSITRTQFSAAGVQVSSSSLSSVTWAGRTTHAYP
jgi:hypothetical protein